MLSAQCDELREMAGQLQEHGTFVGFGGTTNTDPLMHGAAIVMREAADTIWELRDMVHKERAENAKLREDLDFERSENGYAIEFLDLMAEHCGTKDCPSLVAYVEQLRAENTELRGLVKDYYSFEHGNCFSCRYYEECHDQSEWRCIAPIRLAERTRDLGIGVNA